MTAEPSREGHREHLAELDGLRGVAALFVVLFHVLIASSRPLADGYLAAPARPAAGSVTWWFADTPLHILWAGPEMVAVFFVLSGYVLALPALRRGWGWFDASYYPRRLLRLYVPVWGAMLFAALLHLPTARHLLPAATWWLNVHPNTITASAAIHTATILWQSSVDQFTSVLWSLRYEVAFSILLPLALAVPILTRDNLPAAVAAGAACLFGILVGAHSGNLLLRFVPVCELGALLAFHARPRSLSPLASGAAAALCATLLCTGYMAQQRSFATATGAPMLCIVLGACLTVWLAKSSAAARRSLSSSPARWLGSRSYSLYLVHEPIVVTLAFALGGSPATITLLVLALPISLLVAELFWRGVEHPAIRIARRAGELAAATWHVRYA